jgi:hypothetical protein
MADDGAGRMLPAAALETRRIAGQPITPKIARQIWDGVPMRVMYPMVNHEGRNQARR